MCNNFFLVTSNKYLGLVKNSKRTCLGHNYIQYIMNTNA